MDNFEILGLDKKCGIPHTYGVTEVVATDEFADWYKKLDELDTAAVYRVVGLLEARGVSLGFPYCSAISNSNYALRELRVQSQGQPLRIFYAFDPKRQAVLLLGGNKAGADRFYETEVPRVEKLWKQYLQDQRE